MDFVSTYGKLGRLHGTERNHFALIGKFQIANGFQPCEQVLFELSTIIDSVRNHRKNLCTQNSQKRESLVNLTSFSEIPIKYSLIAASVRYCMRV